MHDVGVKKLEGAFGFATIQLSSGLPAEISFEPFHPVLRSITVCASTLYVSRAQKANVIVLRKSGMDRRKGVPEYSEVRNLPCIGNPVLVFDKANGFIFGVS